MAALTTAPPAPRANISTSVQPPAKSTRTGARLVILIMFSLSKARRNEFFRWEPLAASVLDGQRAFAFGKATTCKLPTGFRLFFASKALKTGRSFRRSDSQLFMAFWDSAQVAAHAFRIASLGDMSPESSVLRWRTAAPLTETNVGWRDAAPAPGNPPPNLRPVPRLPFTATSLTSRARAASATSDGGFALRIASIDALVSATRW